MSLRLLPSAVVTVDSLVERRLTPSSRSSQTAWYTLRLRLSTIYTLSELRLLAPSTSDLPTEDRLADAFSFSRSLFKQTAAIGDKADDAAAYAEWVTKSWKGLALSRGF